MVNSPSRCEGYRVIYNGFPIQIPISRISGSILKDKICQKSKYEHRKEKSALSAFIH